MIHLNLITVPSSVQSSRRLLLWPAKLKYKVKPERQQPVSAVLPQFLERESLVVILKIWPGQAAFPASDSQCHHWSKSPVISCTICHVWSATVDFVCLFELNRFDLCLMFLVAEHSGDEQYCVFLYVYVCVWWLGPVWQHFRAHTERYRLLWEVCTLCQGTLCNWEWIRQQVEVCYQCMCTVMLPALLITISCSKQAM